MTLRVDFATVATTSADIASGAAKIENTMATMTRDLEILRTSWEGDAQQAYAAAKAQWDEGMSGMREVLASIAQMVDAAGQDYSSMDRRGAVRFD
ncbi:WXG100 family type VII secretion target [Schaalia suimastitidis]|uniref:WXG100 family type VII secretion target n=1 Tax=Schaalia suimastitidis TaxID=121163 RepID=UPI0004206CB5|nr:WXG100 family type VII secretion target [Schaalia suimastitidis]